MYPQNLSEKPDASPQYDIEVMHGYLRTRYYFEYSEIFEGNWR